MSAPIDVVIAALEHHGCEPKGALEKGWTAKCPAHADRTPSLGVKEGSGGTALLKCYAECPADDIVAALGLQLSDLFPPRDEPARSTIVATYDYVDEQGMVLYQVCRMQPKSFRQRKPDGTGGWLWKLGEVRRVLWRLPEVLAAKERGEWIMVCEGEKDAQAMTDLGHCGTTLPGGAGKWRPEYTEMLRGAKVIIVPDNDDPGRKHALDVSNQLEGIAARVRIREPATGKDLSDHLQAGLTLKDLRPFERSDVAEQVIKPSLKVIYARELMAMPGADPSKYLLGPLLYRGHRLVVGAETGSGKTSLINCMAGAVVFGRDFLDWKGAGGTTRVLVLDVEQGTDDVQNAWKRAGLDQAGNRCGLIHEPNGLALDTDAGAQNDLESILKEGWDVVIADPAYNLWSGDPSDQKQVKAIMALFDGWRRDYDFALVMPMHTRKPPPGGKFTINEIYGSKAFTWGAEEIIGLQRLGNGAASLYWWKDRGGKLPAIHSRWGLLYDQEHGFRKDPRGGQSEATWERVREVLEAEPGSSLDELWFKLGGEDGPSSKTIRHALDKLGAVDGGERRVKDRRYRMPPSLFAIDGGGEADVA